MGDEIKTLEIDNWHTIDYPARKQGTVEIVRSKYNRNLYLMECVDGYCFFKVTKPIPITILKVNGEQVMIDGPTHWIGMQKIAEHCKGRVLLGGLGLGLIIHHLVKNKAVKQIDVVELNEDVIDLIKPLLPKGNIQIIRGDIFDRKWQKEKYDTIVLDIWVKSSNKKAKECGTDKKRDMHITQFLFKNWHPEANVFVWGSRDPKINPAVEKASKEYLDFAKGCL